MIENSISAARASGARILLPGTIYNYGPDAFPTLREDSPQNPLTRKGQIRVAMERRLQAAAGGGVRSLIVRAGDFFGPIAGNNWFSQGLVKPGQAVTSILYPGRHGTGHAWAYLPDLAEAMAQLADRESTLGTFERFHFAGQWDADGTQMTNAVRAVVGSPNIPVRSFPWPLLHPPLPIQDTVPGDARDALFVAGTAAVEQRSAAECPQNRASHTLGAGRARNTERSQMSPACYARIARSQS